MDELLSGLQYSHDHGVIHRDIKPANIMLTSEGRAKISDFGIAHVESSAMTQPGTVLGTLAYMAPEQLMGQAVDFRTDIYSAGVMLYELLTGERPFVGGMSAIMHKALNTEPPAPSSLSVTAPPAFDAVVRRAMSKRPDHRYPSATVFAEAIRSALTNQSEATINEAEATRISGVSLRPRPLSTQPVATLPPQVETIPGPVVRRPLMAMIVAAAMVLLAAVGGAWWSLRQTSMAPPSVIAVTPTPPPVVSADPSPRSATIANSPRDTQSMGSTSAALQSAPAQGQTPTAVQPPTLHPAPDLEQNSEPSSFVAVPPVEPLTVTRRFPPAPVERPGKQQVAIASLDSLRRQIAQWASSWNCAILGGELADAAR